jgi:hypothetical protein
VATGLRLAVAGCLSGDSDSTPTPPEVTVTVRLRNLDAAPREFSVVVRQGDAVSDEFSGILPAD